MHGTRTRVAVAEVISRGYSQVRYILSFGVFAILASAVLMTPQMRSKRPPIASGWSRRSTQCSLRPRAPAVWLGSVHVWAPLLLMFCRIEKSSLGARDLDLARKV